MKRGRKTIADKVKPIKHTIQMNYYLIERKQKNRVPELYTVQAQNKALALTKLKALFMLPAKITGYLYCLADYQNSIFTFINR
jgi:hypothetical protein